ncbi:MAG: DUF3237 domain-containing protein [Gammaproteobacteria bacterium]|nr:DUF3237 domain-containing protein [Gammaproteobacteria bacterium]
MKLEHLCSYHGVLREALEVGAGPHGHRMIVEVDGGSFEGPRLRGTLRKAACADWLTIFEGYGHLDVRATFETHDHAFIYVEYTGRIELTDRVKAALAGTGQTEFEEQYFFTSPRMQTGDPRYLWVNNLVCIGRGRVGPGRVEYDMYAVVNG